MTINNITLVEYPTGINGSGIFVSAADLTNAVEFPTVSGKSAGTNIASQGVILTYYDGRGRVSRLQFHEAIGSGSGQVGDAGLPVDYANFASYLGTSANIVKGVDTSAFLQTKLWSFGQNEAIWRKRNR